MYTQVLEGLKAETRAADQAHTEAVAAARRGESQLWQEQLQKAKAASQEQVSPCPCLHNLLMPLACTKSKTLQVGGLVRDNDGGWSSASGHAFTACAHL